MWYRCGCFYLFIFNMVTIIFDTRLSVLPTSMITLQCLYSHPHLVWNKLLLWLGSFSPLSRTLLLSRTYPLSTSLECGHLASSSTCKTLAQPPTLWSILPWNSEHSNNLCPSSISAHCPQWASHYISAHCP